MDLSPFLRAEIHAMVPAYGETDDEVIVFILQSWLTANGEKVAAYTAHVADIMRQLAEAAALASTKKKNQKASR